MVSAITPSANFTKLGNVLIVFAIALLAMWVANNYSTIGNFVQKKTAVAA